MEKKLEGARNEPVTFPRNSVPFNFEVLPERNERCPREQPRYAVMVCRKGGGGAGEGIGLGCRVSVRVSVRVSGMRVQLCKVLVQGSCAGPSGVQDLFVQGHSFVVQGHCARPLCKAVVRAGQLCKAVE